MYVSPQIECVLGYTPAEWLADRELFWKLRHPDDREALRSAVATDEATSDAFRLTAKDGRRIWFRGGRVVVRDGQGEPLYAQGYMVDITDEKTAEHRRLELAARQRMLLDSTSEGIFGSDLEGRCMFPRAAQVPDRSCRCLHGVDREQGGAP